MDEPRSAASLALAVLALALSSQPVPASTGDCDRTNLAACNCSRPGLEHLTPGMYSDVVANYMSHATQTSSPQFLVRAQEFMECTGGMIRFADSSNIFAEPIEDLGTRAKEGLNLFDAYFMSYSHFPEASALGLAETLNDRIRTSMEQLQWEDFYPKVKIMGQYQRNGRGDLDFLMFDGDFFVPLVRLDLLEKFEKPLPNTWEELSDLVQFFHGMDLNEDGEPDYGFCHFPWSGSGIIWDRWWPELIYSSWATMAQTGGYSQGFFFDSETFEPKLNTQSFKEAVEMWKQLVNSSGEGCTTDNMITGRCAIGFSPPGCWKGVFLNGVARRDENGTVLWQPTLANGDYAEPYRLQPFGSLKVEDSDSGEMVQCSRERCPYSEPINAHGHVSANDRASILPPSPLEGQLINRAPFFWSGGLGTLIRKSAKTVVKDMLWDYFVYINSPVTSVNDVATYSSWIDSWRRTQLTVEGENFVKLSTWSPDAYAEHRSVMEKSLGQESNAAFNVRIPGIKEYTFDHLGSAMAQFVANEITLDELVSIVSKGWEETTNVHGLLNQLETYRASLGQEALGTQELCNLHRDEMDLEDESMCSDAMVYQIVLIVVGGVVLFGVLFRFALWVFMTARAKRRLLQEQQQRLQELVKESLENVGTLKYPMILVHAASFMSLGKMICHEYLRDRRDVELRFLDTCRDVEEFLDDKNIVFLSHQWLGYTNPDPSSVQYNCACRAIQKLVRDRSWRLSKTYVWCDFCSIPQRCHAIQTLAIASLPIYASKVSAFIIVAPPALHRGWEEVEQRGSLSGRGSTSENESCRCNLQTYQRRAWCRAEVLSHALSKGVSSMYVATEEGLSPVVEHDALIDEAIYVFEGDLTCCRMKHESMEMCDRQRLVVPFLGLYSYVVHTLMWNSEQMDQSTLEFFQKIIAQKERVFPSTFHFNSATKPEKARPLFKGLLSIMEGEVKSTTETQFEEFRMSKHSSLNLNNSHSAAYRPASSEERRAALPVKISMMDDKSYFGHPGDELPLPPEERSSPAVSPPASHQVDVWITRPYVAPPEGLL